MVLLSFQLMEGHTDERVFSSFTYALTQDGVFLNQSLSYIKTHWESLSINTRSSIISRLKQDVEKWELALLEWDLMKSFTEERARMPESVVSLSSARSWLSFYNKYKDKITTS